MRKILIVDDDEAIIDYLHAKLEARYDIISTNAPENVVKLARQHAPDVIVCDIDMPEMDGGDVSRAMLEDQELRHIPILFLTALASPADMKQLQSQLGGRRAISKSAPMDELIARIEELINK